MTKYILYKEKGNYNHLKQKTSVREIKKHKRLPNLSAKYLFSNGVRLLRMACWEQRFQCFNFLRCCERGGEKKQPIHGTPFENDDFCVFAFAKSSNSLSTWIWHQQILNTGKTKQTVYITLPNK